MWVSIPWPLPPPLPMVMGLPPPCGVGGGGGTTNNSSSSRPGTCNAHPYLRNVGNRVHEKSPFFQIGHFGVILWKTRYEQIENPPGGWTSPSKTSIEVSSWKRYEKVILFDSLPSPLGVFVGTYPAECAGPAGYETTCLKSGWGGWNDVMGSVQWHMSKCFPQISGNWMKLDQAIFQIAIIFEIPGVVVVLIFNKSLVGAGENVCYSIADCFIGLQLCFLGNFLLSEISQKHCVEPTSEIWTGSVSHLCSSNWPHSRSLREGTSRHYLTKTGRGKSSKCPKWWFLCWSTTPQHLGHRICIPKIVTDFWHVHMRITKNSGWVWPSQLYAVFISHCKDP